MRSPTASDNAEPREPISLEKSILKGLSGYSIREASIPFEPHCLKSQLTVDVHVELHTTHPLGFRLPLGCRLHIEGVPSLWNKTVREVAKDGPNFTGEADSHRRPLGEAGGVPVHLRQK